MYLSQMIVNFNGSGRKRLICVQTVRFNCRVPILAAVRIQLQRLTVKRSNSVLGSKLAWASKDKRFWMGLYLGFSIGGSIYLGTFGFRLLGL
jgi:hypothetical protein